MSEIVLGKLDGQSQELCY